MPLMAQQRESYSALSVGYINKVWATDFDGETYYENIFGQEDKRLHGLQIAYHYTNCLPIGLGIHTGLGYEWCMSYSKKVKEMGFGRFNEHSLYLPIHATWAIPVGKNASIAPYAGIGFNWKMSANLKKGSYEGLWTPIEYRDRFQNPNDIATVKYGENGWPHAINAQMEYGINARIDKALIGFTYARGLTDHGFYRKEHRKTRQDKLALTIGILMFQE